MPLFRVAFNVQLLVEARDEREAIFEGRCSLRDADRERRSARAVVEVVKSPAQLDAIERDGFPWGRRSPKKCGELAIEAEEAPSTQVELFAAGAGR